jgi:hypothetical protein
MAVERMTGGCVFSDDIGTLNDRLTLFAKP